MTGNRWARGDRGATLVEYALVVALLMVVSIGAIQRLESNGSSKLDDGAADRGRPAEQLNIPANVGSIVGGGSGTSVGSGPADVHLFQISFVATQDPGTDWAATVTLRAQNVSSSDLWAGVVISGHWIYSEQANPVPVPRDITATCTTTDDGLCTITLSNLKKSGNGGVDSVEFSGITLSGPTGINWVPQAGDPTTSGPIARP